MEVDAEKEAARHLSRIPLIGFEEDDGAEHAKEVASLFVTADVPFSYCCWNIVLISWTVDC